MTLLRLVHDPQSPPRCSSHITGSNHFFRSSRSAALLLILALFCTSINGQFKIVDSTSFRTQKGVSNSSSMAFVQINHYVDPIISDQSRAFSIQRGGEDDTNLIKVHIQYQNKNSLQGFPMANGVEATPKKNTPSHLNRIMASNKNSQFRKGKVYMSGRSESDKILPSLLSSIGDKYDPSLRRKFHSRPKLQSRKDLSVIANSVHRAIIMQENQRILKKLRVASDTTKRPTKVGTFKSSCRCVVIGDKCPKMQITVARCNPNENLCCF